MKKIFKLFICLLLTILVFNIASCSHNSGTDIGDGNGEFITFVAEDVVTNSVTGENGKYTVLVGYVSISEEDKCGTLYLVGSTAPAGDYYKITVTVNAGSEVEALNASYSIPNVNYGNLNFAGWYLDSEFTNGKRVAMNNQLGDVNIIYAKYINYGDAGLICVVCVLIVFAMLALLFGVVSLFKLLPKKKDVEKPVSAPVVQNTTTNDGKIKFEDIKDDDMMAAALVASIDYHNECGKDVKVVSIKEVK